MVAIVHSNLRNKLFKWKFFTVQDLNVWIQNESVTSFPRSVWGLHTWSGDGLYAYVRVSPLSSGWCCRSCDMVFAFHTSHFWPKSCIKSRGRCLATDGWLAGWSAVQPPSFQFHVSTSDTGPAVQHERDRLRSLVGSSSQPVFARCLMQCWNTASAILCLFAALCPSSSSWNLGFQTLRMFLETSVAIKKFASNQAGKED